MERIRNRSRSQTTNRQIEEVGGTSEQNSQRRDNGCLTSDDSWTANGSPEESGRWYGVTVGDGKKVKKTTCLVGILRNHVLLIPNTALAL